MTMRKLPPIVSRSKTATQTKVVVPRLFARAAVNLPAQYTVDGQSGWSQSMIDDLGGGGARLITCEDLAAGTQFLLRFVFDGTPITVTARVAMSLFDRIRDRYVHGVAFLTIDPQHRQTIVARVSYVAAPPSFPPINP